MSLANFWRTKYLDGFWREAHIVVEHPNYTFPGGVLACSIYPFVAKEVTSWRIHNNQKPMCERCSGLIGWLKLEVAFDELKKKAQESGVKIRFIKSTFDIGPTKL